MGRGDGATSGPTQEAADMARLDHADIQKLAGIMRPRGFRWDGTISLGHVMTATAMLAGALTIYVNQARIDERQDAAITETVRRVGDLEDAGRRSDATMAQMQQMLARIDGRMEGVQQSQQRLERRLEGRE